MFSNGPGRSNRASDGADRPSQEGVVRTPVRRTGHDALAGRPAIDPALHRGADGTTVVAAVGRTRRGLRRNFGARADNQTPRLESSAAAPRSRRTRTTAGACRADR